ncbi:MAG TPA: pirin family protein [Ignavibacteria bacterium]|nr:pirin family protein [Ignavibacteria bacterium]HRF64857.1 pirin family protein [Ignavibacteria bacterium]HRJ04763.1 pirin family protein [Ignavibacteria bacterium]HRJ85117.1 pirin family protein [Ignavibacteria bacterium]
MKTTLHKAETRGKADHGWLNSHHTFSFASYHNPERVRFGLLRVLNDDIVHAGEGFGTHPHDNMEIISIPLSGALAHKDSTGNEHVINTGDVQIMSAGSGLYHSEYNASKKEAVNFLQIWVFPKERDIEPRYDQRSYDPDDRKNKFQLVVSPEKESSSLWINQDSYFSLTDLEKGSSIEYKLHNPANGIYLFLIEGSIRAGDIQLNKRDGLGIEDTNSINLTAAENSQLLLIEVPMK